MLSQKMLLLGMSLPISCLVVKNDAFIISRSTDHHGPEVGLAELNTLADLFEGETPELDETWQQEEVLDINGVSELGIELKKNHIDDVDSDLADFLSFDET